MTKLKSIDSILKKQRDFILAETFSAIYDTGVELQNEHRKVIRDWTHKPGFRVQSSRKPGLYTIKIVPTGRYAPIYGYVDKGTKPHIIAAKNVPLLHFQTGYSARTAPVAKYNQGTGTASGAWVAKAQVNHPGTEAREFSKTFLEELSPTFGERIMAAIKLGIQKAKR